MQTRVERPAATMSAVIAPPRRNIVPECKEVKICSLLKLRLSTADIATLLCLSERTVDGHRGHIRKKLGLNRRADLAEVMAGI